MIFIRSRQKQQNVNEMLFVWMKGLASEPAFLWMKPGLAAGARQSPGLQRPQPMSDHADDSFNKGSLNSGRFHFNQGRDLLSNGSVGKKRREKKSTQLDHKDAGKKRTDAMERGKIILKGNSWSTGQVWVRTGPLSWRWAVPQTFTHPFFYIKEKPWMCHSVQFLLWMYTECTFKA